MEHIFVFGLFVMAVAIAWWVRSNRRFAFGALAGQNERLRYAGVEIDAGQGACAAVQAHCQVRYLMAEAPRLPLHDCTAARCTCNYLQFDDRRRQVRTALSGHGRSLMVEAAYDARKQRMSQAILEIGDRRAHWSPVGTPYATVGERRLRADRLRSTRWMS